MNALPDQTMFLPMTRSMRLRIEATIEQLVALLDEIDGDSDIEAANDDEPWLGWPDEWVGRGAYTLRSTGNDDRELENEHDEDGGDDEPDSDDEPSLGSLDSQPHQGTWGIAGYGDGDDREHQDEGCCPVEDHVSSL